MTKKSICKLILISIAILSFTYTSAWAKTIFVDIDATGNNDGTSWENAWNSLSLALLETEPGDEVWVAEGTYVPTHDTRGNQQPRFPDPRTFYLFQPNVQVYGGFQGNETSRDQRDHELYPVILDGERDVFNIFTVDGADDTTVLDGFTVTRGRGAQVGNNARGGAMTILTGNPTIRNCLFTENYGQSGGGAIARNDFTTDKPQITIENTIFLQNSTGGSAAAVWGQNFRFIKCRFLGNEAQSSGGAVDGDILEFYNCEFIGNFGVGNGGAVRSNGPVTAINCTFAFNRTRSFASPGQDQSSLGGAVTIMEGIVFYNNIFVGNTSNFDGFRNDAREAITYARGPNNVFQFNRMEDEDIDFGPNNFLITNTCFNNLYGEDDELGTLDDDVSLCGSSDAINMGSNEFVPDFLTTDLNNRPRIQGGIVDIGAYEYTAVEQLYVNVNNENDNLDGLSWETAFTDIGDALQVSGPETELWVAQGVYSSTQSYLLWGTGRAMYGGFVGNETERTQRDPDINETILDGSNTDFSIIEMFNSDDPSNLTIIDGFTIANGNKGLLLYNSFPLIENCKFNSNGEGGAIQSYDIIEFEEGDEIPRITVVNCEFMNNSSNGIGGAIDGNYFHIEDCLFVNNQAGVDENSSGGAIRGHTLNILNSRFIENLSTNFGGAIRLEVSSHPSYIVNSVFNGNQSYYGGAIQDAGNVNYINLTIVNNRAIADPDPPEEGTGNLGDIGGIASFGTSHITNSIFWNNTQDNDEFENPHFNGITSIQYSASPVGVTEGDGNNNHVISVDPFVDSIGFDAVPGNIDDDLRLSFCSDVPYIDSGDASALPFDIETDINGNPRIVDIQDVGGSGIDLGAYELQNIPEVELTAEIPIPSSVDMDELAVTGPVSIPEGAVYWDARHQKLYAVKTGITTVRWETTTGDLMAQQCAVYVWPDDESLYQIHVAGSQPVNVVEGNEFLDPQITDSESGAALENNLFTADAPGRTLMRLTKATQSQNDPVTFFQLVRSIDWQDQQFLVEQNANIGNEIIPTMQLDDGTQITHDDSCGGPLVYNELSRYCAFDGYHDRDTRTGPIIPVNTDEDETTDDDMVLVFYEKGIKIIDALNEEQIDSPICWPFQPVRYECEWPESPQEIVIASQQGTGLIDAETYGDNWALYYQNDRNLAGFNPNNEHALIAPYDSGNAIFALRSDLGTPTSSSPYVVMTYQDPNDDNKSKIEVFRVIAENETYPFAYTGTAGTLIQAPYPLSILPKCPISEEGAVDGTHGFAGPYWQDRNHDFWARAAGLDGTTETIVMRYFYSSQPGFYDPYGDLEITPGTCFPWLSLYAGDPNTPVNVSFEISWPDEIPELRIGETLVKQKFGLPNITDQASVEIVYQEAEEKGQGQSVLLIDPLRSHFAELVSLPDGMMTENSGGQILFSELPPHLKPRFSYNPTTQLLEFKGIFVEPTAGESYLLLNVITQREQEILRSLSPEPLFQAALDNLFLEAGSPYFLAEDESDSESKAVTAGLANAEGYVTLAFQNSESSGDLPVDLSIIRVTCPLYQGEIKVIEPDCPFDEKLTLRHSGDFAGFTDEYIFEWRTFPDDGGTPPDLAPEAWTFYTATPANGEGANDITISGPGLFTVSDNWFICRYKPINPGPCGDGWSEWTAPQLQEGWIKRIVGEINPFTQRASGGGIEGAEQGFSSYQDREINTIVSMISQAGTRWSGDTPLNCNSLDDFGLIEIYETVLGRGIELSIEGSPPVDYLPANNALLLAAGRIADLYMLLGNEAFADGTDPTIAFGTNDSLVFGNISTTLHSFMNQTPNLLEEELALFRGRDNRFQPSVETFPFYNRLIWNFTNDANGGEVAYALNYNIRDVNGNVDGEISEADARNQYPQGHGDAWGHYLTAVKSYYKLLRHPNYTWVPRAEAVLVGGVPVTVDYLDERKFAKAAAAKARAAEEIINLTYRAFYDEDPSNQWQGYKDDDPERAWGLSEWGSRAGQGAYLDWVVGNAVLPTEDTENTGIQKVDRQTVTELREIASSYVDIQTQVDNADQGLNPLGLASNVVPFDIDPAKIDQGQTHFEQVYDRAKQALDNAVTVFNYANETTQILRRQSDTVNEFQQTAIDQEADFNNRLIELCGYPYGDDIGPGGTYPSGYNGPDIYHYDYMDPVEILGVEAPPTQQLTIALQDLTSNQDGELTQNVVNVTYNISTNGLGVVKPSNWTQPRRAPGEIQQTRSDLLQSIYRFKKAFAEYQALIGDIESQAVAIERKTGVNAEEIEILNTSKGELQSFNSQITVLRGTELVLRKLANAADSMAEAKAEALPLNTEITGGDLTSVPRGTIKIIGAAISGAFSTGADVASMGQLSYQNAKESLEAQTSIDVRALRQAEEIQDEIGILEQLIRREAPLRLELFTLAEVIKQNAGDYQRVVARFQRVLEERLRFRKQAAANVQEYRYKDMAFRIFQNDALQKYRAQFNLAARYAYLAARAYDFETNLLDNDSRGAGSRFLTQIIKARSLGFIQNSEPQPGIESGDPGLADPLARMIRNWDLVLEGQLGFNNPQTERNRFSLRSELFRISSNEEGDSIWRTTLKRHIVPNLLDLPEFQRFCNIFTPHQQVEPAIVIPFDTTINFGLNFFGWPLGGGDNSYDSTNFATKIRSVGVWFSEYNNLGMSNTPRVYMVPVGNDIMRSPTGNGATTREWRLLDQKLPVPFPILPNDLNQNNWIPGNDTLIDTYGEIRKYSSFRANHDGGDFDVSELVADSRLVGRSVWNTRWLIIIPAGTLLANRDEALAKLIDGNLVNGQRDGNGISDIKILFQTYAYSGN